MTQPSEEAIYDRGFKEGHQQALRDVLAVVDNEPTLPRGDDKVCLINHLRKRISALLDEK